MDGSLPVIHVGVADLCVVKSRHLLISSALGSCIGVVLYDPVKHIGGLAHVMLPTQIHTDSEHPPGKFADMAIPAMSEEMRVSGALSRRIVAKIAGGAEMFADTGIVSIGERNVFAVKTILRKAGIRVVASDTGGHHARSIHFDTGTGDVTVRSVRYGVKEL